MRVFLTGASGFVGSAVYTRLLADGVPVRAAFRKPPLDPMGGDVCVAPELTADSNWRELLLDVSVVIHAAARVHVMDDAATDPTQEFRKVNVDGTLNLARQAAAAGIKRFIFLSSIKVNGEQTFPRHPYTAESMPAPVDPYGVSKLEAEIGLQSIANETGLEVVIIRPVLVYGPGVKANFLAMIRWLSKGFPLPFGAIHNKRSLVALDNLVDLIVTCVNHPAAFNQVFLVSDGEDLSTTELLRRMGLALGKPALLIPVPKAILEVGATLLGKQSLSRRLCGSLQVNIDKTCSELGWTPPIALDDALRATARHYLEESKK